MSWITLVVALVQALPQILKWWGDHTNKPVAKQELKDCIGALCQTKPQPL